MSFFSKGHRRALEGVAQVSQSAAAISRSHRPRGANVNSMAIIEDLCATPAPCASTPLRFQSNLSVHGEPCPRSSRCTLTDNPSPEPRDDPIHEPARLDDVVAEVSLASEDQFAQAFAAAKKLNEGWAEVPAPQRGRVIAAIGRLVEANKEAWQP